MTVMTVLAREFAPGQRRTPALLWPAAACTLSSPFCAYVLRTRPTFKLSTHYPYLRAVFTGRVVNMGVQNEVTGQFADASNREVDISRTGQLADWTSRGLVNSRSSRCRRQ